MRITPVMLSLLVGAGFSATAATLEVPAGPTMEAPMGVFQEKTADEKAKDAKTKKEEKAEKVSFWVLEAAGKG